MSKKFKIKQSKPLKMAKGIQGMPIGLKKLMVNLVALDKDAIVPEHTHKHEQSTFIFNGELMFELEGERFMLGPGDGILIPANASHSARATRPTLAYDCFCPPRRDYLSKLK